MVTRCEAPTAEGHPCRYAIEKCPHESHRTAREQRLPPVPEQPGSPDAILLRDERALAWWTLGELVAERLSTSQGSAIASLLRILHALGPTPLSEEQALVEAEFRGRIMHGMPPRSAEQWAMAERLYDAESVAEFRRWERLLERDRGDVYQPEFLVDRTGLEGDVP